MKKTILFIAFGVIGSLAQAGHLAAGSLNLNCKSHAPVSGFPISVELTQLNNASFSENEKVPFQVSIKSVRPAWQEIKIIPTIYTGTLWTEDVQVFFNSEQGAVYVGIYLDELDQSYLQYADGKRVDLICE